MQSLFSKFVLRAFLSFLLWTASYYSGFAQTCKKPFFVSNACGNNKVRITIPVHPNNDKTSYILDWGDGTTDLVLVSTATPLPLSLEHVYGGFPAIIKLYSSSCTSDITSASAPAGNNIVLTKLESSSDGKAAQLNFVGFNTGEDYEILRQVNGLPAWDVAVTNAKNGSSTITGLDSNLNYCFKLRSISAVCGTPESNNTVCTVKLTPNLISSTEVVLAWNAPPSDLPVPIDIEREIVGLAGSTNILPTSLGTVSYTDKNINCPNVYLYRPSYRYVSNGRTVIIKGPAVVIDPKKSTSKEKPTNLVSIGYDNYNDNKININITFSNPTNTNYTFYRAENNSSNFTLAGKSLTTDFSDSTNISSKKSYYCYKYTYQNQCGVTSDFSDHFCTVLLTNPKQDLLQWTPFNVTSTTTSSPMLISYSIEYFDESSNGYRPFPISVNLLNDLAINIQSYLDDIDQEEYKIKVLAKHFPTDTVFSIYSYSNTITIENPPRIITPTAFTPDGSGPIDSESFKIITKFIASGKISIYDRWGGLVYESDDLSKTWDGNLNNTTNPAPAGPYAFKIKAFGRSGKAYPILGSVMLLR
jgi:gliding motility-associated-like protein